VTGWVTTGGVPPSPGPPEPPLARREYEAAGPDVEHAVVTIRQLKPSLRHSARAADSAAEDVLPLRVRNPHPPDGFRPNAEATHWLPLE